MSENKTKVAFLCGAHKDGSFAQCKSFLHSHGRQYNKGLPCRNACKISNTLVYCIDKEAVRDAAKEIHPGKIKKFTSVRILTK